MRRSLIPTLSFLLLAAAALAARSLSAETLSGTFDGELVDLQESHGSFNFTIAEEITGRNRIVSALSPYSISLRPGDRITASGTLTGAIFAAHTVEVAGDSTSAGGTPEYRELAVCLPVESSEEEIAALDFEIGITAAVPEFSSRPSASAKIYLDFDGHPAIT